MPSDLVVNDKILPKLVKDHYPPKISLSFLIYRNVITTKEIETFFKTKTSRTRFYNKFVELMNLTIGNHYRTINGRKWKLKKNNEFQDFDLVFIYYTTKPVDQNSLEEFLNCQIIGFITMFYTDYNVMTASDGRKILFLFEIHVDPQYQNEKLGTILIDNFHDLVKLLNKSRCTCWGTQLVAFEDNTRAKSWYMNKHGYQPSEETLDDSRCKLLVKKFTN